MQGLKVVVFILLVDMNVPNINEIDFEKIKCSGNNFVTFANEDNTCVYFRLPEFTCTTGISIQEYNGSKKAYLTFHVGLDTGLFDNVNKLLKDIANEKFPDADLQLLGQDGFLKIKLELLQDGKVDAAIYNENKEPVESEVLIPGCKVMSICQLKGCWSMNGRCSIAIKGEQLRVWPPVTSYPVDHMCIIESESEDEEDEQQDLYVPFTSNCMINDDQE